MAKRRKRTNSKIPAKGRLRDMADQLWSISIRTDWNWKCAVCGNTQCEAHHLIPRANQATRYTLENGIALCASHHQFCKLVSPHQNAAGWMSWMKQHQPLRHEWLVKTIESGCHRQFTGTTNAVYYCGVIQSFREYVDDDQFQKIAGIAFSRYLLECETPDL